MSAAGIEMEGPAAKKPKLCSGLVTPRESTDFDPFSFEPDASISANDQFPDELEDLAPLPTNGSLQNGPDFSLGPQNCVNGPGPMAKYPPESFSQPNSANNSVLQGLLMNKDSPPVADSMPPVNSTGPRSVPAQQIANASPQRPPTAPGPQVNYARSPASSAQQSIMSPSNMAMAQRPNMMQGQRMMNPNMPPGANMYMSDSGPEPSPMSQPVFSSAPVSSAQMQHSYVASQGPPRFRQMLPQRQAMLNGGGPRQPMRPNINMMQPGPGMISRPSMNQMSPHFGGPEPSPYGGGMPGNPAMMRHPSGGQPPLDFMSPNAGNAPPQFAPQMGQQRPPFSQATVMVPPNPMDQGLNSTPLSGVSNSGPPSVGSLLPMAPPTNGAPPMRGPPPGPNAPGGAQNAQDPEKRKLIQQQLVLLLHAHKCQQREKDSPNGARMACSLPHCGTMKEVLAHMTTCSNGRSCTFAHCASSRQIISHWKNCNREDCPVCKPLKQIATDRRPGDNTPLLPNLPLDRIPPLGPGGQNFGGDLGPLGPSRPPSFPNPPTANTPGGHTKVAAFGAAGQGPPELGGHHLPPPDQPNNVKDWHQHVTMELRNHLVSKLVKAIFPSPDPAAMHDQRIRDLITYARKVEKEMFELANDREEYYHLLAEKIYKIQKELQEKKQKRLQQQIGPGAGPSVPLGNIDMEAPPNRTAPVSSTELTRARSMGVMGPGNFPQTSSSSSLPGEIKTEPGANEPRGPMSTQIKPDPDRVKTEPGDSTVKQEPDAVDVKPQTKAKAPKKFFPDELRASLMPVWDKLERMDEAIPFRVPVDPELLQIPDYFDIVKNPMDLSTIKEKLNTGEYKDPWDFCDDIWTMFDNAWLYNRKNSKVYKYCTKLSDCFVDEMDPVMRSLGYCCGRKLAFTPLALFCYGQPMCTIARDQPYYVYETSSSNYGVTVSERYTYCVKCWDALPDAGINLSEDPNSHDNMVAKSQFKLTKNDQIDYEPFIDCGHCGRKWHTICALHNDKIFPGGFVCDNCRHEITKPKPENRFTAKRLPHCQLSRHIENRVNGFIKRQHSTGSCTEQAGDVIIRVLCSQDKEVDCKPLMKNRYCSKGEMPDKFPYKAKAIFAFEVIEGVEVCFFGLHVQEYGSDAGSPNARRVYVAYLDSVHFFQPRDLRTKVYHEILLGYLEYVKQLGYTMAHIWACPPSEGDDYIFHCHPPEQKIPKPKRLQEWYKKMLDKGIIERTVTDYKDIHKQAQEDRLSFPTELPYFEGDFWPNVIEDCIREADAEEAERRREMEMMALADQQEDDTDDLFDQLTGKGKKKNPSKAKKKNQKNKSVSKNKKKQGGGTGNDIVDKLYSNMEKHKEVFFTIRLTTAQTQLKEVRDPDSNIASELMDGRDTFLQRARDDHWEFSSLRRAKFSTMCLCHALHTQGPDQPYQCNECQSNNARWHCTQCEDFDLCEVCMEKLKHPHKMDPINPLIGGDGDGGDSSKAGDQNSRTESIQRCIQSLVHACQCRDANCRRLSCHKMKRVVSHTKLCRKRQQGNCPVCKQLIALCCYHAKHCANLACQVPFCQNIRQKLKEQKEAQRRQADRMMSRRMNNMMLQNRADGAPMPSSTPYTHPNLPSQHSNLPSQPPMHPQPPMRMPINQMGGVPPRQLPPGQAPPPPPYRAPSMPGPQGPTMRQMAPQSQQSWPGEGPSDFANQQQMQHNPMQMQRGAVPRMMPPQGMRPGVPSDQQQMMVQQMIGRLKSARNEEEQGHIIQEIKQNPTLFSMLLRLQKTQPNRNAQAPQIGQMLQSQPQGGPGPTWQQGGGPPPAQMGGQQQFYGSQNRVPQPGYSGPPQQFMGGFGAQRPPMSPHQQQLLNQVRSPPGQGLVRSPMPSRSPSENAFR